MATNKEPVTREELLAELRIVMSALNEIEKKGSTKIRCPRCGGILKRVGPGAIVCNTEGCVEAIPRGMIRTGYQEEHSN